MTTTDKNRFIQFVKDWMLVIGMVTGVVLYLAYHSLDVLHPAGPVLEKICKTAQPIFLFSMLFLSFCKIEPRELKFHKWQWWLLLIQTGLYIALALVLVFAARSDSALADFINGKRIPVEAAMLCLICPTATACAVVTRKLGGSMAEVVTYTILINLAVAIVVPLFVPLIYPMGGMSFIAAFWRILAKVFPLLILPCLLAWFIRYAFPSLHAWFLKHIDAAFYIWAISLVLAILMSTRAIVNSHSGIRTLAGIALASLLACAFQFYTGKRIGGKYGSSISAGQAMGQKNTVFAIWMGYTFMDPIVSVAGGFYSIWHNCFNTWQLRRAGHGKADRTKH